MDGMTGMEAARRIRRQSDNCILVFVTTAVISLWKAMMWSLLLSSETISARKTLFHSGFLSIQAFTGIRYIEVVSDRVPIRVPLRSILYADTFRNAVCPSYRRRSVRSYLTFHKFEEQIRDCPNFLTVIVAVSLIWIVYRKLLKEASLLDNGGVVRSGNVALLLSVKPIFSISLRQMKKYLALKMPFSD